MGFAPYTVISEQRKGKISMSYINYTPQLFETLLKTYESMINENMVVEVDELMMALGEDFSNNLEWNDKDELEPSQKAMAHALLEEIVACFMLRLTQSKPTGLYSRARCTGIVVT
jgi:hypothetical protein